METGEWGTGILRTLIALRGNFFFAAMAEEVVSLAIIGTAGRDQATMSKATKQSIEAMVAAAAKYLKEEELEDKNVEIVSGGAAVADHVAVLLYLRGYVKRLRLCLPSLWDSAKRQYKESGLLTVAGRRSNQLHLQFQRVSGISSLDQLHSVVTDKIHRNNVKIEFYEGFQERNRAIAEYADHLLAFGFDKDMTAGTAQTYNLCKSPRKMYIVIDTQ